MASTQFRVNAKNVARAYYELSDPAPQLRSYLEDALRSAIEPLAGRHVRQEGRCGLDVQKTVGEEIRRFGFDVIKTLITGIDPSTEVKRSMDSINAAQREKEATPARQAWSDRDADSADAEREALQGEGQANYRREIASGLVDQINSLKEAGMDADSVNDVVLFNRYLDVLRGIADSTNAKTLILPAATPGGYDQLYQQMVSALQTSSATAGNGRNRPRHFLTESCTFFIAAVSLAPSA